MNKSGAAGRYVQRARDLAQHWQRPFGTTLGKLLLSRLWHGRSPQEFEEYGFAAKPLSQWREYVDEDKLQFWRRCTDHGLATVPLIGLLTKGDRPPVPVGVGLAATPPELATLLAPMGDFDGFAKPVGAGQGYGAFVFEVRGGVVTSPGGEGDIKSFFDYCAGRRVNERGYILQPRIRAHPHLRDMMPGPGLGTIRVVTFAGRDGRVETPWATLKIPRRGAIICQSRLGGLIIDIDVATGRLGYAVGPVPNSSIVGRLDTHPETGVPFRDFAMPDWERAMELVRNGARAFAELPCLGWDVVCTTDGPRLLETNFEFGIHSQQAALNRGLRRDLESQFNRCLPVALTSTIRTERRR